MSSRSSQSKFLETLRAVSWLVGPVIIPLLWILKIEAFWTPGYTSVFTPIDLSFFESLSRADGPYRLLVPPAMMSLATSLVLLIGPLLLFIVILGVRHICPGSRWVRLAMSLAAGGLLFTASTPGSNPNLLFECLFAIAIISSVHHHTSRLIWVLLLSTVIFWSLSLSKSYQVGITYLWVTIGTVEALHRICVDSLDFKAHTPYTRLQAVFREFAKYAFYFAFAFLVIHASFATGTIEISTIWPTLFILPALSIFAALIMPWQLKTWMRLASLAPATLLTNDLNIVIVGSIFWISLQLITESARRFWPKQNASVHALCVSSLLIICTVGVTLQMRDMRLTRAFDPAWTSALQQIDPRDSTLYIVGDALPYASMFYSGPIIQNPQILFESSPEVFKSKMLAERVENILVDREFLRKHWTKLIQDGQPPDVINQAVLTRILLYEGKPVETETLNIPPIEGIHAKESVQNRIIRISLN